MIIGNLRDWWQTELNIPLSGWPYGQVRTARTKQRKGGKDILKSQQ